MTAAPARSRARLILPVLGIAVAAWYGWHRWQLAHAPYEWSGMVAVMRGIVLRGAGPGEMLGHVGALVAFAVILVWASVRRVKKTTM